MAIMKNTRPSPCEAYVALQMAVDGSYVTGGEPAFDGYSLVFPPQGVLDEYYSPVSEIEKAIHREGLGHNQNDLAFTLEKDGYQALVFEHNGQYFLSGYLYDLQAGKLEFMTYPALRSESAEGIIRLLTQSAAGLDGRLTGYSRSRAVEIIDAVAELHLTGDRQLDRKMIADFARERILSRFDSISLDALEERSFEERTVSKVLSGDLNSISGPSLELIVRSFEKHAAPMMEVVEASRRPGYYGPSFWTAGIDARFPGWEETKGIRFADFNGDKLCHVIFKDGHTTPLSSLTKNSLAELYSGLRTWARKARKESPAKKTNRGLAY